MTRKRVPVTKAALGTQVNIMTNYMDRVFQASTVELEKPKVSNYKLTSVENKEVPSDLKGKTGILFLQLGGPDTLDDVEPFLYNLFSDPDIIRLPVPFL